MGEKTNKSHVGLYMTWVSNITKSTEAMDAHWNIEYTMMYTAVPISIICII